MREKMIYITRQCHHANLYIKSKVLKTKPYIERKLSRSRNLFVILFIFLDESAFS